MGVLHGLRISRRLSLLPVVLVLVASAAPAQTAADPQLSIVLGHVFTAAEFQLILEAVKTLVIGGIAGIFIWLFNVKAKSLELDRAFYNGVVVDRVKAAQEVGKGFLALQTRYEQTLVAVINPPGATARYVDGRLDLTNANDVWPAALKRLFAFQRGLPGEIVRLRGAVGTRRFEIGEDHYRGLLDRIAQFERNIDYAGIKLGTELRRIAQPNEAQTQEQSRRIRATFTAYAVAILIELDASSERLHVDYADLIRTMPRKKQDLAAPPRIRSEVRAYARTAEVQALLKDFRPNWSDEDALRLRTSEALCEMPIAEVEEIVRRA